MKYTPWISFAKYQLDVFESRIHKAMNKESKYKENCDNDECDEHAKFEPPAPHVLVEVELDEDDAIGDQCDEDQADHG